MFKEVECSQKSILTYVEQRLDEIRSVEITDFEIAEEMREEYNYLMDYLNSIKKISSEINELVKNNKQFSMMSYPNRTHSINEGRGTSQHLFTLITNYIKEKCPGGGR